MTFYNTTTSSHSGFKAYEEEGRKKVVELLQSLSFKHISATIDEYDEIDLIAFSDKYKPLVVEVKSRNVKIDAYPDVLIEKYKYDNLMKFAELGFMPFYICTYLDGFIMINLYNQKDLQVQQLHLPSTTVDTSSLAYKECYFLTPSPKGIIRNETVDID
ncbi:YraN family protein [Echinicola sp. 20G]|uniref:YraN family protein n=1 Tax=Echinicola sp. 20G TaxID=2781961 RepID=UPI001910DC4F|nr:YraN family protein [Echinicola sp. 20G]